jgi:hypothetical protein
MIQPRDLDLLRELAVMRVADREQVKVAAGFGSTTRVNTRLLALTRAGLLRRFFLGSGGGRKALYALSIKGAQMIQLPCRGPRTRAISLPPYYGYDEAHFSLRPVYAFSRVIARFPL